MVCESSGFNHKSDSNRFVFSNDLLCGCLQYSFIHSGNDGNLLSANHYLL